MNRGVITISESGMVSMPTDTVWMTMQEIADMYNVPQFGIKKIGLKFGSLQYYSYLCSCKSISYEQ